MPILSGTSYALCRIACSWRRARHHQRCYGETSAYSGDAATHRRGGQLRVIQHGALPLLAKAFLLPTAAIDGTAPQQGNSISRASPLERILCLPPCAHPSCRCPRFAFGGQDFAPPHWPPFHFSPHLCGQKRHPTLLWWRLLRNTACRHTLDVVSSGGGYGRWIWGLRREVLNLRVEMMGSRAMTMATPYDLPYRSEEQELMLRRKIGKVEAPGMQHRNICRDAGGVDEALDENMVQSHMHS
ncbi:hypothetical protein GOP47_0015504 [Adiantum capillus-veneris]|uniref:Uncharacterized protein n=1 Tax=Adiantum capillus-veneris TaxID=13818 RepID=A0A9D4ZBA8_ADICA|nr:hypothetical protein GOP47_0015504 [Adiantum capillus-veneris]